MQNLSHSLEGSFLTRLFPPPAFLSFPTVGFDMSDHSVRFIEFKGRPGKMRVKRYGQKGIPDGVVSYGDIKDRNALKSALSAIAKDYKLSYIRASLPEEKAFVFKTKVPILGPEDTRENIYFQLEENVPISSKEAIFDYVFIKSENRFSAEREVVVSVFPEKVVRDYYDIYRSAGLIPLSFEMEADAIVRSLIALGDMETYMIVDFGQQRTGLSIVSDGVVQFTSTVEVGGNSLTSALQRHFNISWAEAEEMKHDGVFAPTGSHKEFYHTLVNSIASLKDEINKHYIFWQTHQDKNGVRQKPIKRIILVGGDSNLMGLTEYLNSSMKTEVCLAKVWQNVCSLEEYIPSISFSSSLSFATAVGLALRHSD